MTWVYLDDKFHSSRKTYAAGNDGAGLFARALSYCGDHLTDGWVPQGWACEASRPATRKKVTAAEFWVVVDGGEEFHYETGDGIYTVHVPGPGFFIPDFLLLNPSRPQVEAGRSELSKKRSEAGKRGAFARWHGKVDGKTMASAWQDDGKTMAPNPSPTPTPTFTPPTPSNDEEQGGNIKSIEPLQRLLAVLPKDSTIKVLRTARKHKSSEGDYEYAIQCCTGAGVLDPLAVALSTLKKRGEERNAA